MASAVGSVSLHRLGENAGDVLNGTNDFAYPMDSYAKTCALVRSEKNYSIQLNMKHGHLFEFPEFFLFADQYIRGGKPMPVVARSSTAAKSAPRSSRRPS